MHFVVSRHNSILNVLHWTYTSCRLRRRVKPCSSLRTCATKKKKNCINPYISSLPKGTECKLRAIRRFTINGSQIGRNNGPRIRMMLQSLVEFKCSSRVSIVFQHFPLPSTFGCHPLHICAHSIVVIVNSYSQDSLGSLLSDYVFVQMFHDLIRNGQKWGSLGNYYS